MYTIPKSEGRVQKGHKELTEHRPGAWKSCILNISRIWAPQSVRQRDEPPGPWKRRAGPATVRCRYRAPIKASPHLCLRTAQLAQFARAHISRSRYIPLPVTTWYMLTNPVMVTISTRIGVINRILKVQSFASLNRTPFCSISSTSICGFHFHPR